MMRSATTLAVLLAVLGSAASGAAVDPFADEVVSFTPGERAGFGADQLPAIVLGPPLGRGDGEGSFDVVALGDGGSIVIALRDGGICDGPGPDFTVFENAFYGGGTTVFAEVGIVAVSADGVSFTEFPYDAQSFVGLAGRTPVYSHPDNDISPTDPAVSGGDSFDLATVGLAAAAYVRITDPSAAIPDPGNRVPPGNSAGFDLDAVAAVHACGITAASPSPTVTASASPTPSATIVTPTSTPATPAPVLAGDANGDGAVDGKDTRQTIAEIYDGDGDTAAAAGGGLVPSHAGVDANRDGRITAADLVILHSRNRVAWGHRRG